MMIVSFLKIAWLITLMPVAALLTASFFILLVLRKTEKSKFRMFGCVILGFLLGAAAVIFYVGVLFQPVYLEDIFNHKHASFQKCKSMKSCCPKMMSK